VITIPRKRLSSGTNELYRICDRPANDLRLRRCGAV
jgi:hypothetical protein